MADLRKHNACYGGFSGPHFHLAEYNYYLLENYQNAIPKSHHYDVW